MPDPTAAVEAAAEAWYRTYRRGRELSRVPWWELPATDQHFIREQVLPIVAAVAPIVAAAAWDEGREAPVGASNPYLDDEMWSDDAGR